MLRIVTAALLSLLLVPFTAIAQPNIVISEIMPNPDATRDSDGEYIELYNTTGSTINLNGWTISDLGDSHTIASDVFVEGEDFVVLARSSSPGFTPDYTYTGDISLVNSGDEVVLENTSGSVIDRIEYDLSGWPYDSGASMEFIGEPSDDNNVSSNWQEATTQRGYLVGSFSTDLGSPGVNADGGQLPVELASFDVRANGDKAVLSWTTTTEKNNSGFTIQRRRSDGGWTERGFVDGTGTTDRPQSYRFTDAAVPYEAATLKYRLKQVDTDGTVHFSETITFERSVSEIKLLGTTPNPARQQTKVQYAVSNRTDVTVQLYDALGRRVRTLVSGHQKGRHQRTLHVSELSSGVYFLRLQAGGKVRTEKLTVVR